MNADQPWYRRRPLPRGEIVGDFIVGEQVITATHEALVDVALAGLEDGGHEGLVFWAGRELGSTTVYVTALVPRAEHGPQGVHAEREEVGEIARRARAMKLGVLAQVHSHPGPDGRHSDGDDDMILMPFEGMLSIVVPHYGRKFAAMTDCAVHQYQGGQWVWCNPASVSRQIVIVPPKVHT